MQRLSPWKISPEGYKAVANLSAFVHHSGIESILLHMIFLRASQLNGCAYCTDMHFKDAVHEGVSAEKLNLLTCWREAPVFTDRERAALEWTEAVTLLTDRHVPDAVYERCKAQLGERDLVNLTIAVGVINTWNRMGVAFQTPPSYKVPASAKASQQAAQAGGGTADLARER